MDTRIPVPPVGTCTGKATIVDISDDPVRGRIRAALDGLPQTADAKRTYLALKRALDEWDRRQDDRSREGA